MLKLNTLVLCVLAFLPIAPIVQTSAPAAAQTANDRHADETAIEQVMKQYHAAILAHDGTALSGLFLPDGNLWLNVLTDSAYARAQAKSPTARKVRVSNFGTSRSWSPRHPRASTRNTARS